VQEGIAHAAIEQPDVIVISAMLEKLPEDICAHIHAHSGCTHIPILVLTDDKHPVDTEKIKATGGACVLRSPKYEHLIAAIGCTTPLSL